MKVVRTVAPSVPEEKKPVTPLPETGFIRLPDVLSIYPVSKSTWWSGVKSGRFPAGVKLSEKTVAWRVDDIRRLIASAGV